MDSQNNRETEGKSKTKKVWTTVGVVAASIAVGVGAFFGGYFTYAAKVDEGMRSLIWAKEMIQKEYNYEITDEAFYNAVFDGINGILDPYSAYMTADEYQGVKESATGKWSGLGMQFSTLGTDGEKRILVSRVTGNSPAYFAGVKEGSYLIGYGKTRESLVEAGTDYNPFYSFMSEREAGEPFYLCLREGKDGEEYFVELAKSSFVESYVFYRSDDSAYAFTGDNADVLTPQDAALPALGADTAYIRLTQFNGRAAQEFADTMSVFKQEKKKHLILDLRGNGGGYMDILVQIASYFCKEGSGGNPVIAAAQYRNGQKIEFRASGNDFYEYFTDESRFCVMADNGTASASECLIGCMVDYGALPLENVYLSERASYRTVDGVQSFEVVAKTYGKGIMQTTFARNIFKGNTEAIKLTTANILWPVSGKCIHGVGVTTADGAKKISENYFQDGEIKAVAADFLANG